MARDRNFRVSGRAFERLSGMGQPALDGLPVLAECVAHHL